MDSLSMIDDHFPTTAISPVDSVYEKPVSNTKAINAHGGEIIATTTDGNKNIEHIAKDCLYIAKTLEILIWISQEYDCKIIQQLSILGIGSWNRAG